MLDILITWNNEKGVGDITFSDNDIETTEGLESVTIISLFSDARAADDDLLPDNLRGTDKRGFWGDSTSERDSDRVGSKLWLLSRAKTQQEALDIAKKYAEDSLAWMIEEDIAARIDVLAERGGTLSGALRIDLRINILRKSGEVVSLQFQKAWEAMYT